MRIENLRTDQFSDRRRVVVDVSWEDCGRTTQEVYFETIAPFAEDLAPSVDAFLLASMPIATWLGERRILGQGSVGPRLRARIEALAPVKGMRRRGRLAHSSLVRVYPNARTLYPAFASGSTSGCAPATTAVALALARRVSEAWLGSDGLGLASPPLGSHALLLHHFSTAAVEIHLGHVNTTRLEKTRLVADWEGALPFLRSCLYLEVPPDGLVNCGRCEKCVRTRLALVALGKLDRATSFPLGELTPGMLAVVELTPRNAPFYQECLEPLERLGRHDLVAPLR